MKNLHYLLLNAFLLGFWTLAWIITLGGIVKFNWFLLGSICNLVAFIGFYRQLKTKPKKGSIKINEK